MDGPISAATMADYLKTPPAVAVFDVLSSAGFIFHDPEKSILDGFVTELIKQGPTTYADLSSALERSMPSASEIVAAVAEHNSVAVSGVPIDQFLGLFQFAMQARQRLGAAAGWAAA